MVDHHEKAVNELERRAENGSTEVRQWAAKTLPKVQQHLEQAKTIKETLDKGN
jgi:predicted outer membrane protein